MGRSTLHTTVRITQIRKCRWSQHKNTTRSIHDSFLDHSILIVSVVRTYVSSPSSPKAGCQKSSQPPRLSQNTVDTGFTLLGVNPVEMKRLKRPGRHVRRPRGLGPDSRRPQNWRAPNKCNMAKEVGRCVRLKFASAYYFGVVRL